VLKFGHHLMQLRRITSGGRFIPEIDGLRFAAISSVVCFHLYGYMRVKSGIPALGLAGTALHHGLRGVPLFFAISGFILGRPFAQHYIRGAEAPRLKAYFLRRLSRLEPPYIISMVVFFALLAFSGRHEVSHLLASLAYVHNLVYGMPSTISSVAWSLEVEVQFYCLIPLIAVLYKAPRGIRRTVLLAAMLAGTVHLLAIPDRVHLSLLGWFQCFAAGLLLADLYTDGWNPRQHWGFDLLSLALWPAIFLLNDQLTWVLMPAMSFILYVAAFRSFFFRRFFTLSMVTATGGMCYTIYLIHYQVISFAGRFSSRPAIIVAAALVLLALASLAFFISVERPCMDKHWPRKVMRLFNLPSRPPEVSGQTPRSSVSTVPVKADFHK
jgi:peptidoglycan/LPS O-acetylase OafA/YrhL